MAKFFKWIECYKSNWRYDTFLLENLLSTVKEMGKKVYNPLYINEVCSCWDGIKTEKEYYFSQDAEVFTC